MKNHLPSLKNANEALRKGDYKEATKAYNLLSQFNPKLKEICNYNIELISFREKNRPKVDSNPDQSSKLTAGSREALALYFDESYYLSQRTDVANAKSVNALSHYLKSGWNEDRLSNPNGVFDNRYYLENNSDLQNKNINPLQHYVNNGFKELHRKISPTFDPTYYLECYPDIKDSKLTPLAHYLKYGHKEGKQPHRFFHSPVLKESISYHNTYYNTLKAAKVPLYPQKALQPKDEKYTARNVDLYIQDNFSLIKSKKNTTGNKIAIVSANFGNREGLADWGKLPNIDYFCFTDKFDMNGGHVTLLRPDYFELDLKRTSLFYKTNSIHYFDDYDIIIWCDQNVNIVNLTSIYTCLMNQEFTIASFRHPERKCVYSESEKIISSKRDKAEKVISQMTRYEKAGFPKNYGLFETNIMVYKPTNQMKTLMRSWWGEIVSGAKRDQLSFTYVLWALGVHCFNLETGALNARNNSNYEYKYHD